MGSTDWAQLGPLLQESLLQTLLMVGVTVLVGGALGLALGVLLVGLVGLALDLPPLVSGLLAVAVLVLAGASLTYGPCSNTDWEWITAAAEAIEASENSPVLTTLLLPGIGTIRELRRAQHRARLDEQPTALAEERLAALDLARHRDAVLALWHSG
mgnify:CR=1 FL=1